MRRPARIDNSRPDVYASIVEGSAFAAGYFLGRREAVLDEMRAMKAAGRDPFFIRCRLSVARMAHRMFLMEVKLARSVTAFLGKEAA